jgi:hypothetical protein
MRRNLKEDLRMRFRTAFVSACIAIGAIATLAWAADISGKWVAQVQGQGGQTRETTFNFKVDGSKLTGTVSGMRGENPISDGTVTGDDISFTVALSFNGNDIKMNYKGKVSGDEIKFTRTVEGRPPQQFTAKRVK